MWFTIYIFSCDMTEYNMIDLNYVRLTVICLFSETSPCRRDRKFPAIPAGESWTKLPWKTVRKQSQRRLGATWGSREGRNSFIRWVQTLTAFLSYMLHLLHLISASSSRGCKCSAKRSSLVPVQILLCMSLNYSKV